MQDGTRKGIGGRKPKRPSEKQSKRAMVTFTPGEWRDLKKAAGDEAGYAAFTRIAAAIKEIGQLEPAAGEQRY